MRIFCHFQCCLKKPSLCIHSFTGWLRAFSFFLPVKENIKTNHSLSSLSWNGWQALDFLSAAGWECCPMAASTSTSTLPGGWLWGWDQDRAEQEWTWEESRMHVGQFNAPGNTVPSIFFPHCVFLCIGLVVIAYFLK